LADFSQGNFGPQFLIDGKTNDQQGWAIVPVTGITHWVVFQLKEPVGFEEGTIFTFKLLHRFNLLDHTIGRFRLSAATTKAKLSLGLADEFRSALDVAVEKQSPEQKQLLLKYYRNADPNLQKLQTDLAAARMPLPIDEKVKELKAQLVEVSKPVPIDGKLLQLRTDLEMSKQQQNNPRLTASQDLAWALINSPAFLFNH
jgi:hypothetical protein